MGSKRKCTGTFCVMNNTYDTANCELFEMCDNYTPEPDTKGMESVIDIAMKQFSIDENDRKKLEVLFNAYVSQYMSTYCAIR